MSGGNIMMRLRRTLVCCAVGATALAACTAPTGGGGGGGPVGTATTLRASTLTDGESRNGVTSRDGAYVVYLSTTTDPAYGADGNGAGLDVFRWQRSTDTIVRITGGDGPAVDATVADDGTVAFTSTATDLDGSDGNGAGPDVFVSDGTTTTRVTDGSGHSGGAVISADGARVLLHSYDDLSGFGSPGAVLYDVAGDSFAIVAPDLLGQNNQARSLSSNGAFALVDDGGILKVLETATTLEKTAAVPTFTPPFTYVAPVASVHGLADDGDLVYSSVTFTASGTPTVLSGVLLRWDFDTEGTTTIASTGVPFLSGQSASGQHVVVTEISAGSPFSVNAVGSVRVLNRNTSTWVSVVGSGVADSISDDGRYVAFDSNDDSIDPPDANGGGRDVFQWDRGA
jgi:hypothetical protein